MGSSTPMGRKAGQSHSSCLLHPLLLQADKALVHHIHRQVLIGQRCFNLIQDGGTNWGQSRGRGPSVLGSGASPACSDRRWTQQWHLPRSAATGLPLVTTNSYLLRDWSSSYPTGWRVERVAVWTSTMTTNSEAKQNTASSFHC